MNGYEDCCPAGELAEVCKESPGRVEVPDRDREVELVLRGPDGHMVDRHLPGGLRNVDLSRSL